ncbi:hypothetical protein, partial [Methanobrevibacter sp.]|uniref:hypothetical protein n=1 Tax=Methanobrevibacter sp. TaxID=66852 RepID=UPI002E77D264
VAPAADGNAAGGDNVQPVQAEADDPVADVAVDVNNIGETDYTLLWSVVALNYGPDTAYDTVVRITGSDNLFLTNYKVLDGSFDPATSKWYVGDMPAGTASALLLETYKVDVLLDQGYGPYYVDALIVSDSFDPDLSNNYDIAWVGLDASAEETTNTLPEAGNPLAMALLALFAIGIGGIKRRF